MSKGGEIYMITNVVTSKKYIGQSKFSTKPGKIGGAKSRWVKHISNAKNGKDECRALVTAIRMYGLENFRFEILLQCDIDSMDYYERKFIDTYNSLHPNGYNLESGGTGCKVMSLESRILISLNSRFKSVSVEDKKKILNILEEYKLDTLPYGMHYSNDTVSGYEGFVVVGEKSKKVFTAKSRTLSEKFAQAIEYYELLEKGHIDAIDTFNKKIDDEVLILISKSKRSKDPEVLRAMESLGITEIPLYIRYEKRNHRFYVKIKGDTKCHYFKKYDPTESLRLCIEYLKTRQQRESVFAVDSINMEQQQGESQPL
jgi:group I intron endonuclease